MLTSPPACLWCEYTDLVASPDGRLTDELLPEDRPPREACGVFGVWAPGEDVAKLAYFGLYALQHRGQESAGIAVSDGHRIMVHKEMGLVAQVFDEPALRALRGHIAGEGRNAQLGLHIGHRSQRTRAAQRTRVAQQAVHAGDDVPIEDVQFFQQPARVEAGILDALDWQGRKLVQRQAR